MEINNLSLAQRDKILEIIKDQIDARRKLIIEKKKKIEKKGKVNHFLEEVKEDYEKYFKYIVQEKQQQYNSMRLIKNYLDDLIKTEKLANLDLLNIKKEQNTILVEMDKIKVELNKLIE